MFKRIALMFAFVLCIMPSFAFAADSAHTRQLISLHKQLITLLQREVALMQDPSYTYLSIFPTSGVVPLFTTFIVHHPSGTEGINFGDGHTTGTIGCAKNARGWCDLSNPVAHVYQFPGDYVVDLFKHISIDQVQIVSTHTISIVAATSTRYNPNQ